MHKMINMLLDGFCLSFYTVYNGQTMFKRRYLVFVFSFFFVFCLFVCFFFVFFFFFVLFLLIFTSYHIMKVLLSCVNLLSKLYNGWYISVMQRAQVEYSGKYRAVMHRKARLL